MKRLPSSQKGKRGWSVRVSRRLKKRWGYCCYDRREIVIAHDCERNGVDRWVFLHELLHKLCPWMDEEAVDALAFRLDVAIDRTDNIDKPRKPAIIERMQKTCPWMTRRHVAFCSDEIIECLDVMEL